MKELKGKTAVVTGAGSGLGRAMALAFSREGMNLALADVDEAGLKETASQVKGFSMRGDVSKESDVQAFANEIPDPFLICKNPGVSPLGAVWEKTPADLQ